jgi:hypothetical protein
LIQKYKIYIIIIIIIIYILGEPLWFSGEVMEGENKKNESKRSRVRYPARATS